MDKKLTKTDKPSEAKQAYLDAGGTSGLEMSDEYYWRMAAKLWRMRYEEERQLKLVGKGVYL